MNIEALIAIPLHIALVDVGIGAFPLPRSRYRPQKTKSRVCGYIRKTQGFGFYKVLLVIAT